MPCWQNRNLPNAEQIGNGTYNYKHDFYNFAKQTTMQDTVIKKEHPVLERRFITAPVPDLLYDKYDIDFERVIGMRKDDC